VGDRVAEPEGVVAEIVEPNDDRLRVFRGEDDRGVTLWEIDRFIADRRRGHRLGLPATADDVPQYRRELADGVAALMGDFPREPAPGRILGETTFHDGGVVVTRYRVETEPHMRVPVTRYADPSKPSRRAVIWLEFADDAAELHSHLASLIAEGDLVYHVEPRATGAARPETDDDALYSMALAKPIVAGRVHDVRSARRFIEQSIGDDETSVLLVATGGEACSIASVCALFDDHARVLLHRPIAGWRRYLDKEVRPEYTAFLPHQLKVCDLPEVWAALAPTPLRIVRMMDVDGQPAAGGEVDGALTAVRQAYELTGAFDCFEYVGEGDVLENMFNSLEGCAAQ
jgi:hypothetical protein